MEIVKNKGEKRGRKGLDILNIEEFLMQVIFYVKL